jgi:Ca2+:H+ antiporter
MGARVRQSRLGVWATVLVFLTVGGDWLERALLVVTILPIVLLSKSLGKVLDHEIAAIGAPTALSGVLIALIVFTPEGVSALRAAYANQLQRTVNLCLGACLSTLGLTLPAWWRSG